MAASVFVKAAFMTVLTLVSVFSVTLVARSLNSDPASDSLLGVMTAGNDQASASTQPSPDSMNQDSWDGSASPEFFLDDDDHEHEELSGALLASGAFFRDHDEHDDDEDDHESREHRCSSRRFDD